MVGCFVINCTAAEYYKAANHSTVGTTSLGYNVNDRRTNPVNMSRGPGYLNFCHRFWSRRGEDS